MKAERRRLPGKIAVVTGGLSGIGAAVAERFAREGAMAVVRADLSAASSILGDEPLPSIRVDVADEASVVTMLDAVVARYGRIDCVVHSAGIGKVVPFLDTPVELFDRVMAVNLRGSFLIGREAARRMVATGGGAIVNVGSVSGLVGNAARSAYGTSKGALVQLSAVMALELGRQGIRVNVLAPGPVATPMAADAHSPETTRAWLDRVPLHRYGTPEEMAAVAAFLCSDEASFITGHVLAADGGFTAAGLLS